MKKLFIVMLSVFALMLVGCSNPANSNPANSGPTSDPYLLGLDNCEVTLAAIVEVVQDDWEYDLSMIFCYPGMEPSSSQQVVHGYALKGFISNPSDDDDDDYTDFKYYANEDFSTVVIKYKYKYTGIDSYTDIYAQYNKK